MAPAAALSDSFFLLSGWFWLDVKRRLHGSQAAFVWEAATASASGCSASASGCCEQEVACPDACAITRRQIIMWHGEAL